ncbi:hypothetical protein BPSOL_1220 [Bifidobacterium pseudolongum]|nr:hypothetical protein BPSOL_1220 [Bifidobacterium pseudolongum]
MRNADGVSTKAMGLNARIRICAPSTPLLHSSPLCHTSMARRFQ